MSQWLRLVRWYAATALRPDVTIEELLERAPTSHWSVRQRDATLVRFGRFLWVVSLSDATLSVLRARTFVSTPASPTSDGRFTRVRLPALYSTHFFQTLLFNQVTNVRHLFLFGLKSHSCRSLINNSARLRYS